MSKTLKNYLSTSWHHRYFWIMALAVAALLISDPAAAQAWAQKTKSIADDIVLGLRILCYPIALGAGIWIVIAIWTGSKRLQDMTNWIIGAALLIALPDLVKMIPTS
nr:TrbC/VirB2 family protein [uncultured Cardiobacterium sp.]